MFLLCPTQIQAATKVKLNKTNVSINIGDSIRLKVTGTKNKITWSSLNKRVASVSSNGKVTGKALGKTTIKANVGRKMLKCTVNVKNVLSVNKSSITIQEEGSVKISFRTGGTVSLEVDDSSIISCKWDDGEWINNTKELHITGIKSGIAYITISNSYNNEEIVVKVVVEKNTNDDDLNNSDDHATEENFYEILKESIDIKLIIPHNGTNNRYVEIEYVNHSGYDIELNGYTFNNGYSCLLDCEGNPYTLEDGYKIKLAYFRSPIWSDRFNNRYNDMYLDNNSTGWTMIKVNGESIKFTYDRNGTVEVGY